MEIVCSIMFALIRSVIENTLITDDKRQLVTDDIIPDLLKLSQKHDMTHIVAEGLIKNSLIDKSNDYYYQFQAGLMASVYRYGMINYVYANVCDAFEKNRIDFLPLKGCVMRELYREPWMRTSCDIDIYINENDLDKAVNLLTDNYEFEREHTTSHDVSMFASNGVHLELHYDLIEEGVAKSASDVLKTVWNNSKPKDGYKHWYEMNDEMFYFYHISHMAKHFEHGGCGIRPFLDVWLLDKRENSKRDAMLSRGELYKFANVVRTVSKVWFGGADMDSISRQVQDYIINGGVYGNSENRIALQQQQKGGKLKYAMFKIFVPYDIIKFHYPILKKYRFLTPVMEVRRWGKLIFRGGVKRSVKELSINKNIDKSEAEFMQIFLENVGLN